MWLPEKDFGKILAYLPAADMENVGGNQFAEAKDTRGNLS